MPATGRGPTPFRLIDCGARRNSCCNRCAAVCAWLPRSALATSSTSVLGHAPMSSDRVILSALLPITDVMDATTRLETAAWRAEKVCELPTCLPVEILTGSRDRCCDAESQKTHANDFHGVSHQAWRHPLQAGKPLIEVHRKQPLDNHGPEKSARKRPHLSNLEPNCAAHGGCFVRRKHREMGAVRDTCAPGEEVSSLAGGQGGIRTRGGCYTTHAFQACALNHSATCPFSAVGRSYSAVDRLGNGIFPHPTRLARVRAAIWGIDGGGS